MKRSAPSTVLALAAAVAIAAGLAPIQASAQALDLIGLGGRNAQLSSAQISALPHVSLTVSIEGNAHAFEGVPLAVLLARVGAPAGKNLKGADLSDVVLVTAAGGYVVALSLADADPMIRKDRIILADKADGEPLPVGVGPYRLVVEGDLRGARSERMVSGIAVRRLADAPAR